MGLLVYAVCRTGSLDPTTLPTGVGGSAVHAACTERACALFSETHGPRGGASEADFEAFDRVIEAAHEQGPTLPVRFGTVFDDDALLSRALRLRSEALTQTLANVEGKVELAITVRRAARVVTRPARVASPEPVLASTDGTGALKAAPGPVSARNAAPEPVSDLVRFCRHELSDLRALAEEVRIEDAGAIRDAGVMRCLVRRPLSNLFVTAFEDLRDALAFEGRIGPPSPCYAFGTQTLA